MRNRITTVQPRSQRSASRRYAVIVPVVVALSLPILAINANSGDDPTKHIGKDGKNRRDVGVIIQLALKRSRHQLRDARNLCDSYKTGARQNDDESLIALANCFKSGIGRPKSLLRSKRLFEAAAEQGSSEAHVALGQFYRDGRIVKKDLQQAAHHFRTAAQAGLPAAMIEYGLVLRRMNSDRRVACNWFERAAQTGAKSGIRLLGDCHAQGIGDRHDRLYAKELYRKAAELGDRTAILKLAGHVFKGVGAKIAAEEGCQWASEAAARYNQAASKGLAYCLSAIR